MADRALKNDEILGLVLAALGHAGLVWVLVNAKPPEPLPPVERVSVTLADEMGAVSTSPNPQSNPAPDKGPVLGEPAPPPVPEVAAAPEPAPAPRAGAAAKVPPKPPQQAQKPPTKWPFAPPAKTPPTKTPPRTKGGASVLDPGYEKGLAGGSGKDKTPPASKASAQQVASWDSSIKAKVVRRWNACPVSGLDISSLRASVRFTLNADGTVGTIEPPVVTGITDANRAQVRPFTDCAIKAIKTAAPFTGMPAEFHDQWKQRKLNFTK